jgi:hypothetical protein
MPDHLRLAIRALTALARETEHDFPGVIAHILAQVAGNLGSSYALIESRPGSWEASLIDDLVKGTVGHNDEYLPPPMDTKLTDAKVQQIKDAALYGEKPGPEPGTWRPRTTADVAAEFGVSASTVSDIANGRTWRWLK